MYTTKVWGRTLEIISNQYYSKHHLELYAGGYCSLHYHRERANKFILESGSVEIIEVYGPQIVRHLLAAGEEYCVPSLVVHMFVVHASGTMIEEYYPDRCGMVLESDIIRLYPGGYLEDVELLTQLPGIMA